MSMKNNGTMETAHRSELSDENNCMEEVVPDVVSRSPTICSSPSDIDEIPDYDFCDLYSSYECKLNKTYGIRRALEISPFNPRTVDFTRASETPQEHLEKVIVERKMVPSVITKPLKSYPNYDDKQNIEAIYNLTNCGSKRLILRSSRSASPEWAQMVRKEFVRLRTQATKEIEELEEYRNKIYPRKRKNWMKFIFGGVNDDGTPLYGHHPTRQILFELHESKKTKVCSVICEYLMKDATELQFGIYWLYCLLASLNDAVANQVVPELRKVVLKCVSIREQLEESDPEYNQKVVSINLLLAVIVHCHNQTDLKEQ